MSHSPLTATGLTHTWGSTALTLETPCRVRPLSLLPQYKGVKRLGYLKEPPPADRDSQLAQHLTPPSMPKVWPRASQKLLPETTRTNERFPHLAFWLWIFRNFQTLIVHTIQFAIFIKRTANAERARVRKRRVKKLSNLSQKGSVWKHRAGSGRETTMAGADRFSTGNDWTSEPHLWFEASCCGFDFGGFTSVLELVPHPHDTEACGETHLALFLTLEVNTDKVIHKLLMILSWRWVKLIISKNHDSQTDLILENMQCKGNPSFSRAQPPETEWQGPSRFLPFLPIWNLSSTRFSVQPLYTI